MAAIHHLIDRVVFYGLLVTIAVTAIPYGSVQPWWTALFECVIFVLAILGIIDLLITKDQLPAGIAIALPLVLLSLFLVFQSLPLFATNDSIIPGLRLSISADPFATQLLAVKLLALILAGVLLLRYANTERRLRTVVYVVLGVGVASALFGLLRQGTGGATWFFPLPRPERGFAQFVNRNHFGYAMEMTLALAAGIAIRGSRGFRERLLFMAMAAFLLITLIISNSRGAIFASFCQVLFLLIVVNPASLGFHDSDTEQSRVRRILGGFTVKAVLVIGLVLVFAYGIRWVGGEAVVRNIELTGDSFTEQGGHEQRENVSRRNIWGATWELAKAHPVVGSGFGAYWVAITKHHDASGKFIPQEAHNDYLEAMAGGGIVGMVLILWFAWGFVKRAALAVKASDRWTTGVALGALTGVFGVMIHSFVDFGLHIPVNALIFTVLLVFATPKSLRGAAIQRMHRLPDDGYRTLTAREGNPDAALLYEHRSI